MPGGKYASSRTARWFDARATEDELLTGVYLKVRPRELLETMMLARAFELQNRAHVEAARTGDAVANALLVAERAVEAAKDATDDAADDVADATQADEPSPHPRSTRS